MNTTHLPDSVLDDLVDTVLDDNPDATTINTGDEQGPSQYVAALPLAQLFPDETYQRALDINRVNQMVKGYDIALVGILEVSRRPDGYALLDGQHRWAMSLNVLGPAGHVVCRIHEGLTVADEATLYHQLNTTRRSLTTWDRWLARRTAGDPVVAAIETCLNDHTLTVTGGVGPDRFRAVAAAEKIYKLGGVELLDTVIGIVRRCWPNDQDACNAVIIEGLSLVLTAGYTDLDHQRLETALSGVLPRQVVARAAAAREVHHGTRGRLAAHVIVDTYNKQSRAGQLVGFLTQQATK